MASNYRQLPSKKGPVLPASSQAPYLANWAQPTNQPQVRREAREIEITGGELSSVVEAPYLTYWLKDVNQPFRNRVKSRQQPTARWEPPQLTSSSTTPANDVSMWAHPTNEPRITKRRQQPQYPANWFGLGGAIASGIGDNLLVDPGYENGSLDSSISSYWSGSLAVGTAQVHSGTQSLQVTTTEAVHPDGFIHLQKSATRFGAGQTFAVSCWLWVPTGTSVQFSGRIINSASTSVGEPNVGSAIVGNNAWQYVSGTFQISMLNTGGKLDPAGMTVGIQAHLVTPATSIVFYADDAQLYALAPFYLPWNLPTWYKSPNQPLNKHRPKRQQPTRPTNFWAVNQPSTSTPLVSQWKRESDPPLRNRIPKRQQPIYSGKEPFYGIPATVTAPMITSWLQRPVQARRQLKRQQPPATSIPPLRFTEAPEISYWAHPVNQPLIRRKKRIQTTNRQVPFQSSGGIKVYNGSIFTIKPVKVWNGTAWITKPAKYWNGSGWKTA